MIKFEILQQRDSVAGFRVKGHAGYADSGSDIVCAAVSVLVYNAINSCERFAGVALDVKDAGETLTCQLPLHPSESVRLLINSLFYGVEQVAEQYPEFVRLQTTNIAKL
ncbi:ribosomal-processing cysteine protease Prp [Alicyclobacillus fastidiosus]|uniref:Ribosomal processing cysteine protease Prp n=1 Tax=Alicyclobacillus fastidiosus TaxID=392011 RepID=A0ABV5AFR7_9BACL|nr:ribosomal-processing cysteine protease Prp [Alicyclobacillus fastidiosus]WEH11684.1 ribosomal-processing cysteine protease Prp [Alicyclobacillus fastidiosus]